MLFLNLSKFWVKAAVDDWIASWVGHGKPMTCEMNYIDVFYFPNFRVFFTYNLHEKM